MKILSLRALLVAGAACALALSANAQVIEFRATLNAAQVAAPNVSTSAATGSAVMLYDLQANTYDLIVSMTGLGAAVTGSALHEAPAGSNADALTQLGADSAYVRSGNSHTATFRNVSHATGDFLRLLQSGVYFSVRTTAFPGGEIRGQLIARPIRMVAKIDVAQEQAAMPAVNFAGITTSGGAVVIYDPASNTVSVRHTLFNFTSTMTNAHIHIGAPGVSGGVLMQLFINGLSANYSALTGSITAAHDGLVFFPAGPQQLNNIRALLTGGCYLNYHSQAFPNGQARGQLSISSETLNTRLGNVATRGFVGPGEQAMIAGLSVQGSEPIRVLITAKGPSLAAFGVTGALANPRLTLNDSAGREIAANDDVGAVAAGSELSRIPGVPTNAVESALVVVLPPGNYTAVVSSAAGTGVALVEAYDLRNVSPAVAIASVNPVSPATRGVAATTARAAPEICEVVSPSVMVAAR